MVEIMSRYIVVAVVTGLGTDSDTLLKPRQEQSFQPGSEAHPPSWSIDNGVKAATA